MHGPGKAVVPHTNAHMLSSENCFGWVGKSVCHQTPTKARAWDYSEGLVPQYFDVSFHIIKLLIFRPRELYFRGRKYPRIILNGFLNHTLMNFRRRRRASVGDPRTLWHRLILLLEFLFRNPVTSSTHAMNFFRVRWILLVILLSSHISEFEKKGFPLSLKIYIKTALNFI